MNNLVIILIAIVVCLMYSSAIVCAVWKLRLTEDKMINDYKIHLANTPLHFENDMKLLNQIIDDEFSQYQIMNLAHRDNLYINQELESQIITDLLRNVLGQISDDLRMRLELYYNSDRLDDIIFNRIKMVVINYTIEINGNYKK